MSQKSLVPGVALTPLRLAAKLSMKKSENVRNEELTQERFFSKIHGLPWELPTKQHHIVPSSAAQGSR